MSSRFSLIMTMYNEAGNMGALLEDIAAQSLVPDEVILVDGGSTDDTVAVCEGRRDVLAGAGCDLQVHVEPGANIPEGRNLAIPRAAHDCICVTDAGCRIDSHWCERITAPIREGRADFVGGFFRPVHHNRFQKVLAALTVADQPPRGFLPSSRSIAFTKTLWQRVGGYPEWLRWGEDTLFNELCLQAGARYVVAADAIVHWEVRPDLKAAILQFYRYALGDGLRRRTSNSHLVNAGAVLATIGLGVFVSPWLFLLFPAYVLLLVARGAGKLGPVDLPLAYGLAFATRIARAVGFLQGVLSRPAARDGGSGK